MFFPSSSSSLFFLLMLGEIFPVLQLPLLLLHLPLDVLMHLLCPVNIQASNADVFLPSLRGKGGIEMKDLSDE